MVLCTAMDGWIHFPPYYAIHLYTNAYISLFYSGESPEAMVLKFPLLYSFLLFLKIIFCDILYFYIVCSVMPCPSVHSNVAALVEN